jgi:hypothetical protein
MSACVTGGRFASLSCRSESPSTSLPGPWNLHAIDLTRLLLDGVLFDSGRAGWPAAATQAIESGKDTKPSPNRGLACARTQDTESGLAAPYPLHATPCRRRTALLLALTFGGKPGYVSTGGNLMGFGKLVYALAIIPLAGIGLKMAYC